MDGAVSCLDIVFPCCRLPQQTEANKSGEDFAGIAAASVAANRPVFPAFMDRPTLIKPDLSPSIKCLHLFNCGNFAGPLDFSAPSPPIAIHHIVVTSQIPHTLTAATTITQQPTFMLYPLVMSTEKDAVPISLNHI